MPSDISRQLPGLHRRLPDLYTLHERHDGFYKPICIAYADAAVLCLERTHMPPVIISLESDEGVSSCGLEWKSPTPSARASWNNLDDAVRDGAYSLALAAVESEYGFVSLMRAETKTGADYYVGPPGTDVEQAYRLEVSGTQLKHAEVSRRLIAKLDQANRGNSDRPAYACVVGFHVLRIAIQELKRGK